MKAKVLAVMAMLLASAWVATWLRMFDPYLAMESWGGLQQKPVRAWIGTVLFYPLLELLYSWPAYIIGGILFALLIKRIQHPALLKTVALGAALGFSIYLTYASLTGEWVMRRPALIFEQLLVYTLAAGFFGFCYHVLILERRAATT